MSAISELVFDDKSVVSYVSLAREQHISIFDAKKNLSCFYEENKDKLNKNEILYGIDKINGENFVIDIKRNEEIENISSLLFSIHSSEIANDSLLNGIINNSLSKPDITINAMLPLYPIQCKEVKYIKPNYKFKSVEIVAGSKANLSAHDESNKVIAGVQEDKEKRKEIKTPSLSKSSNNNKSKQTKRNTNNSLTKMDSFFNKSDKSIEIKPLYYDEEDDIGSDVELPMMNRNNKITNNNSNNDDDESDDEVNDVVESDNDEVSDIIDDNKENEDVKNAEKMKEEKESLNDDFEYNNSVDSEYEEKEENKNPTKGVYKLVSYIDENGFEVTEEKYVEEEVDINEEEKEREKTKKDEFNNNKIKTENPKEKNSKSKNKRSSKSDENEKDVPPKKKSKKSSNGQITISSFFKPK